MNCPNCGKKLDIQAPFLNFCLHCSYEIPEVIREKIYIYRSFNDKLKTLKNHENEIRFSINEIESDIVGIKNDITIALEKSRKNIHKEELTETQEELYEPIEIASKEEKSEKNIKTPIQIDPKAVESSFNWEMFIGFKFFLILGIITIVFGVAFFIKKAFTSGLLGPMGKLSITYLSGIAILFIGNYLKKNINKFLGLSVIGLASIIFYYSTFAGFHLYDIFSQGFAFFVMIVITAFTVILALHYNAMSLAILGLIGGFSSPVLLGSSNPNIIGLFSYITLLNFGLLSIAFKKNWSILNKLGFFFTYLLYSFAFIDGSPTRDFWTFTIFLNIFFFIYSVIPFAFQFFNKSKFLWGELLIIFLNSLIAFSMNLYLIKSRFSVEYTAIITLLYAIYFIILAQKIKENNYNNFIFFLTQALLFLTITIPILFSRNIVTLIWFTQAYLFLYLSKKTDDKRIMLFSAVLMLIALGRFFLFDYKYFSFDYDYYYFMKGFDYKLIARYITIIFALGFLGKFSFDISKINKTAGQIFFSLLIFTLFLTANNEVSGFFKSYIPNFRIIAFSILWAFFAVKLILIGLSKNNSALRKVAIGLYFVTLFKVFFVDISEFSASYKFLSFIVLGIVLVATSYFYQRFKNSLSDNILEKEEDKEEKVLDNK